MSRSVGAGPTTSAADTPRLGVPGVLWLGAAGFAIAITLIFRVDPDQWVVTMVLGLVAASLGVWMILRPRARVAIVSSVVAAVWVVLYAVLAVQQSDDIAALTTDVALIAIGAVAGVASYRSDEYNARMSVLSNTTKASRGWSPVQDEDPLGVAREEA